MAVLKSLLCFFRLWFPVSIQYLPCTCHVPGTMWEALGVCQAIGQCGHCPPGMCYLLTSHTDASGSAVSMAIFRAPLPWGLSWCFFPVPLPKMGFEPHLEHMLIIQSRKHYAVGPVGEETKCYSPLSSTRADLTRSHSAVKSSRTPRRGCALTWGLSEAAAQWQGACLMCAGQAQSSAPRYRISAAMSLDRSPYKQSPVFSWMNTREVLWKGLGFMISLSAGSSHPPEENRLV